MLEYLWREGESDVPTTYAEVGPARGIRSNTVGSALERLYRKRLVGRRKVSHRYRYWALLDRATFHSRLVLDAVDGGEALKDTGVLAAFVDAVGDIDEATLEAYLAGGEWDGKAGAYAIQGRAAAFAHLVHGDLDTVVGLPVRLVQRLARQLAQDVADAGGDAP